jgi:hypothetical protein
VANGAGKRRLIVNPKKKKYLLCKSVLTYLGLQIPVKFKTEGLENEPAFHVRTSLLWSNG